MYSIFDWPVYLDRTTQDGKGGNECRKPYTVRKMAPPSQSLDRTSTWTAYVGNGGVIIVILPSDNSQAAMDSHEPG